MNHIGRTQLIITKSLATQKSDRKRQNLFAQNSLVKISSSPKIRKSPIVKISPEEDFRVAQFATYRPTWQPWCPHIHSHGIRRVTIASPTLDCLPHSGTHFIRVWVAPGSVWKKRSEEISHPSDTRDQTRAVQPVAKHLAVWALCPKYLVKVKFKYKTIEVCREDDICSVGLGIELVGVAKTRPSGARIEMKTTGVVWNNNEYRVKDTGVRRIPQVVGVCVSCVTAYVLSSSWLDLHSE